MTMLDAGPTPELMSEAALRLQRWVSGCYPGPRDTALEIVAEPGADLGPLLGSGLVTEDTWIFADRDTAAGLADATPATVIPTDGSFRYSGDEIVLADEIYIQVFDYSSIGFLTVAGPTVVRITGDEDLAAFLADADRAVAEGVFPEQLAHPSVQLADLTALAASEVLGGVSRLHLDVDGTLRTGPGAPAGAEAPEAVAALDGVLTPGLLAEAHAERPWLARYVRALDAVRRLNSRRPGSVQVSGFGVRFCDGLPAGPVEDVDAPLAVAVDGRPHLLLGAELRMFRVNREAAVVFDAYNAVAPEEAEQLAAQALGLLPEAVRQLHTAVTERLGLPTGGAA
ncbi:daptide biosynthesis RiPP recognition protein [Streptomyces sp. NRRL WC-3742]|uniref:daptide biosynthesis RiPP recognition protein n=1 Tax=Streptomyces sp. NRRL WC-3742 TaxID=1463934 RepID=UPI00068A179C|nr:daptide biosynthesis RiPP recognition protein [Streptomyces sp. NRRL WC-3742]